MDVLCRKAQEKLLVQQAELEAVRDREVAAHEHLNRAMVQVVA